MVVEGTERAAQERAAQERAAQERAARAWQPGARRAGLEGLAAAAAELPRTGAGEDQDRAASEPEVGEPEVELPERRQAAGGDRAEPEEAQVLEESQAPEEAESPGWGPAGMGASVETARASRSGHSIAPV